MATEFFFFIFCMHVGIHHTILCHENFHIPLSRAHEEKDGELSDFIVISMSLIMICCPRELEVNEHVCTSKKDDMSSFFDI